MTAEEKRDRTEGLNRRVLPRAAFAVALTALLPWPGDFVVFADDPRSLWESGVMRALIAGANLGFVALTYSRWKQHLAALALLSLAVQSGVMSWRVGSMGPPDAPWLLYLTVVPLFTAFVAAPLGARLAGNALILLLSALAYSLRHPNALSAPPYWSAIGYLAFSAGLSVAVGEVYFRALVRAWTQEAELNGLRQGLEIELAYRMAELRQVAAYAEGVREREREHLARELHDELGQELTAVRLVLRLAPSADPAAQFAEVGRLLERTQGSVRRILSGLRPRVLDELGLMPAIEGLASELRRHTALQVQVVGHAPRARGEVAVAAFRIVQESLTNVVRHASASTASVSIAEREGQLELRVEDDGVGLRPHEESHRLGLLGIRERVRALGGTTEWSNGPGLRLEVRLPLPPDSPL